MGTTWNRRRDAVVVGLGATVAAVAGLCAFTALAVGSPLQFGTAAAVCAAAWLAVDFVASTAGTEHPAEVRPLSAQPPSPGNVYFFGRQGDSRPRDRRAA